MNIKNWYPSRKCYLLIYQLVYRITLHSKTTYSAQKCGHKLKVFNIENIKVVPLMTSLKIDQYYVAQWKGLKSQGWRYWC